MRTKAFFRNSSFLGLLLTSICVPNAPAQTEPTGCPAIVVSGPAGVTQPGEMMTFQVELRPEPKKNVTFHWTTNKGQVEVGQSTKRIGVRALMEMMGSTLTATVEVNGLPEHCPKLGHETVPFIYDRLYPELFTEFSVPLGSIHRGNLNRAARAQGRNNQIYIIEYFPSGTSQKSMKRKKDRIMTYMVGRLKVYGRSVTIVLTEGERLRTKIYLIEPGMSNPTP